MQLTKQQLEMQEVILLAVHPELSLEEAYLVELERKRGWVKNQEWFYNKLLGIPHQPLPPTLSRVLNALGEEYYFSEGGIMMRGDGSMFISRKLLNEDGSDCTLFQQSQETQDIIYSLICK